MAKKEKIVMTSISEDVSEYFTAGQSVTLNNIELAVYMGFTEIYLLGVDHNYAISIDKNGKKTVDYSIKSHFDKGGFEARCMQIVYSDALTYSYQVCENYAKEHGIKIYNATRGGKLEVFERVRLEDVLK